MKRWIGRWIMGVGIIHVALGFVVYREPLMAILRDGVWNAVDDHAGRPLAYWFVLLGLFTIVLGSLVDWMEGRPLGRKNHMKPLAKILVCGLALLFIGCGDDTESPMDPATSNGNLPPTLTGPEFVFASIGVPVSFDVVASDPDGDVLELSVAAVISFSDWRAGIRAGEVSIDSETGEVSFTPNGHDIPTRILEITAEDPSGATTSIDVLVRVATSSTP